MSRPLVSVSITTYQHEPYIAEALDSVLEQRGDFDLEILLGEDGSVDGTREICEHYARQHPDPISLAVHSRDTMIRIGGRATGRYNFAYNFRRARGDYFCLLDGDDRFLGPDRLAAQLHHLETHPSHSSVSGRVVYMDQNSWWPMRYPEQFSYRQVLAHRVPATGSVMFRRACLSETLEDWMLYEAPVLDAYLFAYATRHGPMAVLPRLVCARRIHPGGVWTPQSASQQDRALLKMSELAHLHLAEEPWEKEFLQQVINEDRSRIDEQERRSRNPLRALRWSRIRKRLRTMRVELSKRSLPLPESVLEGRIKG